MGQQKSHQRPAMEPDPFISPGGGTIGESTTARPDRKSGSEFRLRARRGRDYTTILDFANVNIVSLTPGPEWIAMGRLASLFEFWSEENASASGERTEGTKEEPAGISRSRRVLLIRRICYTAGPQNEKRNANCMKRGVVRVPRYLPNCAAP
jgi:hypothetical protein